MSSRALVWTVIVGLTVLDVLVLLNIAALWVVANPARLIATLPLALGHAFWSAWLCSDFELNDHTTWREFFVGLPMLPLAATPYGWLAVGASTATPTAYYGLAESQQSSRSSCSGSRARSPGASLPAFWAPFFISCVGLSLERIRWRTFASPQRSLAVGPQSPASRSRAIGLPRNHCFPSRAWAVR